jgi:broad specificity phosphatase PhoE
MSKLLLIRHGRTRLHRDDRLWGKTDIPLSNIGIKQAGQLRVRLASEKIKIIYSSTLSRARFTAEIIAAEHKLAVNACDELCECNFGYAEGLTFDEIKRLHPALAEELADRKAVTFPGGESLDQLDDRVRVFLHRLVNLKPQDTVAIVTHGGPLRLIICDLLGMDIKHWQQMRIDLASLSIVETFPGMAYLNLLNDVSHLKAE